MNATPTKRQLDAAALPGAARTRARIASPGRQIEAASRNGSPAFDL
ncbi:MAG: hypothetical protein M9907_00865 [Burkholderiaceae bacterium]|nr:hypothetical protein [Burkholderiaceae bacterium]